MKPRPADLPEFDRPPVVEVVIGVQFEPLRGFRQAHIGRYWNKVRDEYPVTLDQPRLQTFPEGPDGIAGLPTLRIELVGPAPVHRAWFLNRDESLLIQLQDDRLIHNWRYQGDAYPRFEPLLGLFWASVDKLQQVLAEDDVGILKIEQAEVTYINWIATESMGTFFRPTQAATVDAPGVGPAPDFQRWGARYSVREGADLRGNLAVEVQPGHRPDEGKLTSGHQLSLTFRAGTNSSTNREEVSYLLELGRSAIVRTFTALTTETMHEVWGIVR